MSGTGGIGSRQSLIFISLGRWTNGWKGAGRLNETRGSMEKLGVENIATFFVVSGNYDIVTFNRAKNLRSIAECRLATRMAGSINTRLFATQCILDTGAKLSPQRVTAISLGRWTEAVVKEPSEKLALEYIKQVGNKEKELGIQLNAVYRVITGGYYDIISVSQAENLAALGPWSDKLNALANIRTDIMCVITEEEYRECEKRLI